MSNGGVPPFMFPPPRAGGGGKNSSAFSPAVVAIIAVLGSAFLIVSYYRIFAKLCTRWQTRRAVRTELQSQLHGGSVDLDVAPSTPARGLDEALVKKIPIFEYIRGDGFTAETECPVCLMEFADKQELRMLPKCAHAFHISCIDTWLSGHSSCPLCRANVFSEQVMNQYAHPLSPPQLNFFGTPPDGGYSPADYSRGDYGSRFNGRGRSPQPTLRGLLNFEDHQQIQPSLMWSDSGRADEPGEESLRLYDAREFGGDSSARHHVLVIPGSGSLLSSSAPPSSEPPLPGGEKNVVSRTASFKELHTSSRSRGDADHNKWHLHSARRLARRNPFSSMRSFSMGTSRRLVNALEFLDLEGMRSSSNVKGGDKLYSPYEYGITETPDYQPRTGVLTVTPADFPSPSGSRDQDQDLEIGLAGAGGGAGSGSGSAASSSEKRESLRSSPDENNSGGDSADSLVAELKSSSGRQVKGRSLSFRSTFSLKRSLSGGINMLSLRYPGKSNRVASSPSDLKEFNQQ